MMVKFDKAELNKQIEQMLGGQLPGATTPRLVNFLKRRRRGTVPPPEQPVAPGTPMPQQRKQYPFVG